MTHIAEFKKADAKIAATAKSPPAKKHKPDPKLCSPPDQADSKLRDLPVDGAGKVPARDSGDGSTVVRFLLSRDDFRIRLSVYPS